MARKPLQNDTIIAKFKDSQKDNKNLLKAALIRITPDGQVDPSNIGAFLLNPSTWRESKSVNWASQTIPGQNDPIKQWISGGPRTISFQTLFTKDFYRLKITSPIDNIINAGINAVADIASNFFGVSVPPLQDIFSGKPAAFGAEELGIANELNYIRSLALATYDDNSLTRSPPLLALFVGNTFATEATTVNDKITSNSELWILKNYDITITKQLPNLTPMEAIVNIQLEQYAINSASGDLTFPRTLEITSNTPSTSSLLDSFNLG